MLPESRITKLEKALEGLTVTSNEDAVVDKRRALQERYQAECEAYAEWREAHPQEAARDDAAWDDFLRRWCNGEDPEIPVCSDPRLAAYGGEIEALITARWLERRKKMTQEERQKEDETERFIAEHNRRFYKINTPRHPDAAHGQQMTARDHVFEAQLRRLEQAQ